MLKYKITKRNFFLVSFYIFILFSIVCLSSCNSHSSGSSFIARLDEVDTYINAGETTKAISKLKRIENKASNPYEILSIYKRFNTLGEITLSESVLLKGLKRYPLNLEISAVYSYFLLQQKRMKDALKYSYSLKNSKYGSIYTECLLKQVDNNKDSTTYKSFSYILPFIDAWKETQKTYWLRNAAIIYLKNGNYAEASKLQPGDIANSVDAFFWALVQFDNCNYGLSLDDIKIVLNLGSAKEKIESQLLQSDIYVLLDDKNGSEKIRENILASLNKNIEIDSFYRNSVLPILYLNTYYWYDFDKDKKNKYNLITKIITDFPYYVPGLEAYMMYAVYQSAISPHDVFEESLQKKRSTINFLQSPDEIPVVTIHDVEMKIEQAKKLSQDFSSVVVAELEIENYLEPNMSAQKRISSLWKALESTEDKNDQYSPVVLKYALKHLIEQGQQDDAETLFINYIDRKYGNSAKNKTYHIRNAKYNLYDGVFEQKDIEILGYNPADKPDTLETWEAEYAAWFSAYNKDLVTTKRLYEYLVYDNDDVVAVNTINKWADITSLINLANVYSSTGFNDESISLYDTAYQLSKNNNEKAEIMYRTAIILIRMGKISNARKSLVNCLSLNDSLAKAYTLLKTIE